MAIGCIYLYIVIRECLYFARAHIPGAIDRQAHIVWFGVEMGSMRKSHHTQHISVLLKASATHINVFIFYNVIPSIHFAKGTVARCQLDGNHMCIPVLLEFLVYIPYQYGQTTNVLRCRWAVMRTSQVALYIA